MRNGNNSSNKHNDVWRNGGVCSRRQAAAASSMSVLLYHVKFMYIFIDGSRSGASKLNAHVDVE